MPSSKFSRRPPARKRPWVCRAPPDPSDQRRLAAQPPEVNAFVHFLDADPLAPGDQVASFQLQWEPTPKRYAGRSTPDSTHLELVMQQTANPNVYNAILNVWDPFRNPESFLFFGIFVDPAKPFATANFGEVVISGLDFRVIQVLE